eukprot:TRINITY_DN15_c4_g1_i1.p1 TRINITY_DN15_c4_g1~~TRINITY_DN15_c4_g1_i1.p1  ORF type:complete len:787 (+),score=274.43 TRINITY_DN15_c4_g1_i1:247-2607(+)
MLLPSCLLLFIFSSVFGVHHECIHAEMQSHLDLHDVPEAITPQDYNQIFANHAENLRLGKRSTLTYQNIRIRKNVTLLETGADPQRACVNIGDRVYIGYNADRSPSNLCDQSGSATAAPTSSCWYICSAADILTPSLRSLTNNVLDGAIQYLSNTVQVVPVTGTLKLDDSSCTPTSDVALLPYMSTSGGGIADADLFIFVTARPIIGSTVATAIACTYDGQKRAIAGHINFNPAHMSTSDSDAISQIRVAIHELCHVLGYNSVGFSRFFDPNTNSHFAASQVMQNSTVSYGATPRQVLKIVTPNVVQAARNHFGCPTLDGLELEDGGAAGTAGQHWEKRILLNEYMTGTASPNPIVSNMTLAALEDSGWYKVDYTKAEHLDWGYQRGCSFVSGSCKDWTADDGSCFDTGQSGCTYDQVATGVCGLKTWGAPLPPIYQYYSNPNLGGWTVLSDYCPYIVGYPTGDCRYTQTDANTYSGQNFCQDCRCFSGNVRNLDNALASQTVNACYERQCISNSFMKVKVGSRVYYDCANGTSTFLVFADGLFGTVRCPDVKRLCGSADVDNTWPTFISIAPNSGSAGDRVTVTGTNFNSRTMTIEINGYGLSNVVVTRGNGTGIDVAVGTIPTYSPVGVDSISHIMVMDPSTKKTAVAYKVFVLKTPDSIFSELWDSYQTYFIVGIAVVATIIVGGVIGCIVHGLRSRRKVKPITDEDEFLAEARRIFKHYDVDNSGYLDRSEFAKVMRDVARLVGFRDPTQKDVKEALEVIDTDHNNKISFEELAKWWKTFNH